MVAGPRIAEPEEGLTPRGCAFVTIMATITARIYLARIRSPAPHVIAIACRPHTGQAGRQTRALVLGALRLGQQRLFHHHSDLCLRSVLQRVSGAGRGKRHGSLGQHRWHCRCVHRNPGTDIGGHCRPVRPSQTLVYQLHPALRGLLRHVVDGHAGAESVLERSTVGWPGHTRCRVCVHFLQLHAAGSGKPGANRALVRLGVGAGLHRRCAKPYRGAVWLYRSRCQPVRSQSGQR